MAEDLKPLRTFEGDIASSVRTNQGSIVHIALAEDEKRRAQEQNKAAGTKSILFGTLGVILLLASLVIVAFGIYTTMNKTSSVISIPITKKVGLLKVNKEFVFEIDDTMTRSEILQNLLRTTPESTLGDIARVVITEKNATTTVPLGAQEFITRIFPRSPDLFKQSLNTNFEYGVYEDTAQKPFFVFLSNDYDRTSAGLLSWERDMRYEVTDTFTKAATSTEERQARANILSHASFSDTVIKNVELRILRDETGTEYLVYGFPKHDTLIIAPNTQTFFAIKDALN